MGYEQDELMASAGIIFAVRSIKVDYLKPARFNQLLQVNTEITQINKASLEFLQQITHHEQLLVTSGVKIACLDFATLKPKAIPKQLLEHLN